MGTPASGTGPCSCPTTTHAPCPLSPCTPACTSSRWELACPLWLLQAHWCTGLLVALLGWGQVSLSRGVWKSGRAQAPSVMLLVASSAWHHRLPCVIHRLVPSFTNSEAHIVTALWVEMGPDVQTTPGRGWCPAHDAPFLLVKFGDCMHLQLAPACGKAARVLCQSGPQAVLALPGAKHVHVQTFINL